MAPTQRVTKAHPDSTANVVVARWRRVGPICAGFLLGHCCELAARTFVCAGPSAAEMVAQASTGAAKAVQADSVETRGVIAIFAHFKGELPGEGEPPSWVHGLFDVERPGSFSHFYDAMSFGALRISGEVAVRRYQVEGEAAAYLADEPGTPGAYGRFVLDVLRQADEDIDFSRYDNDGPDGLADSGDDDGVADAVFIVTASAPRGFLIDAATGISDLGLDEDFVTNDTGFAGQPVLVAATQGTVQQGRWFEEAAGVTCHEFGHLLGLRDLFNTRYFQQQDAPPAEDSAGIGAWGLMGWGASGWNGDDGPNSFSAWSRMKLGWHNLREVRRSQKRLSLTDVAQSGAMLKIPLTSREYFLLEHRGSSSYYDRNIPGDGLLIWHVERTAPEADLASGVYYPVRDVVDLESADGRWREAGYPAGQTPDNRSGGDNLDFWAHDVGYSDEHAGNLGDGSDLFDGVRFREFGPETNPSSYSNDGVRSIRVSDITVANGVISAQIETQPLLLEVIDLQLRDASGDSVVVVGEDASLRFQLRNAGGLAASEITVVASTGDPFLELLDFEMSFRDLDIDRDSFGLPLSGQFPRLRFGDGFSGSHTAVVTLEVWANNTLVSVEEVEITGVSPRVMVQQLTVVDTSGNGDGRAQPGEFVHLELLVRFERPELIEPLRFELRSLNAGAIPTGLDVVGFIAAKGPFVRSDRSPEFLLRSDLEAGVELAFELSVTSGFQVWRDTLTIEVHEGRDETAPRIGAPLFAYEGADLSLSIPPGLIKEGGAIEAARAFAYRAGDTTLVAEIPLHLVGDRWEGVWRNVEEGAFLLGSRAEDDSGNLGASQLRRVFLLPSTDGLPLPEIPDQLLLRGNPAAVAYSADGRLLAIGSSIGVSLYDMSTATEPRELGILQGHSRSVTDVAFRATDRLLVSSSGDSTVRLWNVATLSEIASLMRHDTRVNAVAFNPNGATLATGASDGVIRVWDVVEQEIVYELTGHTGFITDVAFSPGGRQLVSGSGDGTVRLWDLDRREERAVLEGHSESVTSVAFAPQSGIVASGSFDNTVRLWDAESPGQSRALETDSWVRTLAFSPDGGSLISGGGNGLSLWDLATLQVSAFRGEEFTSVRDVAFSPDGETLVSIGSTGGFPEPIVGLWEVGTGEVRAVIDEFSAGLTSLAVSPDGRLLAAGSGAEIIRVWDLRGGRPSPLGILRGHISAPTRFPGVRALAFSPDGSTLVSAGGDGTVRLWDPVELRQLDSVADEGTGDVAVFSVAFAADGRTVVSTLNGGVSVWDISADGGSQASLKTAGRRVSSVAIDPSGRLMAFGGSSTVEIWDAVAQKALALLEGLQGGLISLAFSRDGAWLARAGWSSNIEIWNTADFIPLKTLVGPSSPSVIAFAPHANLIASGSRDGVVRVWDIRQEVVVRELHGHLFDVAGLVFTPDGRTLISAGGDGTVRLWRAPTSTAIGYETPGLLPTSTELLPAFPNPFNPTVWIPFRLSEPSELRVRIYNTMGQLVRTLELGNYPAGIYTSPGRAVPWDGRDKRGRELAAGVYVYRLDTGSLRLSGKLILLR